MDIKFSIQEISWDGQDMLFKELETTKGTSYHVEDPPKIKEEIERVKKNIGCKVCTSRPSALVLFRPNWGFGLQLGSENTIFKIK